MVVVVLMERMQLEEVDASASSAACHPQKDDFKRKRRGTSAFEDSLLAFLTDSKEKGDDEDRSFLMSLLPTVKTFNSDQKLIFRTEVLQTMMRIKQTSNLQSYPANTSSLPHPPTPYPHSTNSFLPTINQYHDPYQYPPNQPTGTSYPPPPLVSPTESTSSWETLS